MIKHNGKKCLILGCNRLLFAKDLCKYHYNIEAQQRYKDKQKANYKPTGEKEFFLEIWNTSDKTSFLSGKDLARFEEYKDDRDRSSIFYSMFAHVLAKGKYPKFRLYKKNLVLLEPREHNLLDIGTSMQRDRYALENNCDWSLIWNLKEELISEYKTKYES